MSNSNVISKMDSAILGTGRQGTSVDRSKSQNFENALKVVVHAVSMNTKQVKQVKHQNSDINKIHQIGMYSLCISNHYDRHFNTYQLI